jgi:hypothetical protein
MNPTMVLLSCAALALSGPAQPPAKVIVSGKDAGLVTVEGGGKRERYAILEVDGKTKVKVHTDQDMAALNQRYLDDHAKLTETFRTKIQALIEAKDEDGIKKVTEEYKVATAELLKHLSHFTAVGALTLVHGELVMEGKLRTFDYKGEDKALGKGKALVEGEATQAKGADGKITLAIRNGTGAILVTSKAAEEHAKAEGKIRVHGVLRVTGGGLVIEAEKIDVLKK